MKKVLFSGMMCAMFIVSGFLISQKEVKAGGTICTVKGYRQVASCSGMAALYGTSVDDSDKSCYNDFGESDFGEVVILADVNENGECIPAEFNDNSTVCGNGIEEAGEQCDDGNDDDMDGCTSECTQCSIDFSGVGGGPLPCGGQVDNNNNDSDDEAEGDFRVTLKTYDCNGNEESTKIQGSKVKLYDKKGNKEDEDKTNFKGQANFYNIDEGKYYVKCEVDGYVNLKDRSKTYYKSGLEKVQDGKRAKETCYLIKASCNTNTSTEKVAVTGGSESFWDRLMSLVF